MLVDHPGLAEVVVLDLLDDAAPQVLLLVCWGHYPTGRQQARHKTVAGFADGYWQGLEYLRVVLLGYILFCGLSNRSSAIFNLGLD